MMKKVWTLTAFVLLCLFAHAQLNISLLGHLTYPEDLSDVWGYVDTAGNEYGLIGVNNGFSIVDVSNPAMPTELFFIEGPNSIWWDMKVWNGYAYIIHDGITGGTEQGLMIVDMNDLPASIDTFYRTPLGMSTAHNVFIDENGILYVIGADVGNGGVIFCDLNVDPEDPPVLGMYDNAYVHDLYARNDTMWTSEINIGRFAVVDVTDKSTAVVNAPAQTMATQNTTSNFTHNCWLSADGRYLFTTDERPNAFIDAYDVSDLSNITLEDFIQSNPGTNTIVHNTFWIDHYLVTSYYADGVTIHDASKPSNLVEVGNYDTSPTFSGDLGGGFHGAWGVYPYLPSGIILATDIEEGLYVLGPDYKRASYLEGMVTDTFCGTQLNNVTVEVIGLSGTTSTDLTGAYAFGFPDTGTYSVRFSKAGYHTKTITGVSLTSGNTTMLDVDLKPIDGIRLKGVVTDTLGVPIPNALLYFENDDSSIAFFLMADVNGEFDICSFISDDYDVYAGKWSFITERFPETLDATNDSITLALTPGYYDDFIFDFGWTVSGTAVSGIWEQGAPVGTFYFSDPANPGVDITTDFGHECYVTGNGGGGAGTDDVDDGRTILTSPVFDLAAYNDPYVSYYRWFFNDGGAGGDPTDDSLIVKISNGITTATIQALDDTEPFESEWFFEHFRIADFIPPTANMQFIVETGDRAATGHLVEMAFDVFLIEDSVTVDTMVTPPDTNTTSINNIDAGIESIVLEADNNPFAGSTVLRFEIPQTITEAITLVVTGVNGEVILETAIDRSSDSYVLDETLPAGVYFARLQANNAGSQPVKLVKTE